MVQSQDLRVWVNGTIRPRAEAVVSVFDGAFQSGDAVWEGLRVYSGTVFRFQQHINRLRASAKAVMIDIGLTDEELDRAIRDTLAANAGFDNGVHIRLIVSRGERSTSGMDPRNANTPTIAIIAESKPVPPQPPGERLWTASTRRPSPQVLNPMIHHANQLNTIIARLEAIGAGRDAALMLDERGFVAESDTANIFTVTGNVISTPRPIACVHGITRDIVLDLARQVDLVVQERDISLFEVYEADEVFLTGTVREVVPVIDVDGRTIGTGVRGEKTAMLLTRLRELVALECNSSTSKPTPVTSPQPTLA